MPSRLWIIPNNDLEAAAIAKLLAERNETFYVTQQPWGASWANLEPGIREAIDQFRDSNPGATIYGIELAGNAPDGVVNIDHHRYHNEDRYQEKSSLEQVAEILLYPLSRRQQLIAANDKGWIPALKRAGATQVQVEAIRRADRRAQRLSPEAEAAARRDVQSAQRTDACVIVNCSVKPNSAHSDLLFGQSKQILLQHPDQWFYSGPRHHLLTALNVSENSWSGGEQDNGFFGVDYPSKATQEQIISIVNKPVQAIHLDTILYLPLRLDSCGKLCKERDNPETSPNEWLKQCADWITKECPAWTKEDKPSDSLEERTHAYAAFSYFHPFVHDLFPLRGPKSSRSSQSPKKLLPILIRLIRRRFRRTPQTSQKVRPSLTRLIRRLCRKTPQKPQKLQPSLTLVRTDLTKLHLLLSQHHSSTGIYLSNPAFTLESHPQTITLDVKRIDLTIILTDVAILRIHLSSDSQRDLHTTMSLLNEVRRTFPSYWLELVTQGPYERGKNFRPGGQIPLFAQWLPTNPEQASTSTNKLHYIEKAEARQSPILMQHWRHVLYPLQPDDPGKVPAEGLKFNLLGDDRCFLAASLQVDDYADISEAEWMRLAFVDEGGGGWAYNEEFLNTAETKKLHFYDRFHHWGTRYLITDYSFLQVLSKGAPDYLRMHLRHHYNTLCLLALMQKFSVLTLSHRLAELLAAYTNSDRAYRDTHHRRCRKLASDLSTYVALYDFAEVSSQLQATELFKMLRERMHIQALFEELKNQIEFTINEEGKNYEEYIQRALQFFIPASLATAILGFSYGFDKYAELFKGDLSPNPVDWLVTGVAFIGPMVLAFLFAQSLFWLSKRLR